MFNVLRGIGVPPVIVGIFRGAVEAAILAALAYLSAVLPDISQGEPWQALLPLALFALRTLEGLADEIDPGK